MKDLCGCGHPTTSHANATPLKRGGCSVPGCTCTVARAAIDEAKRVSREAKAKTVAK